MSWCTARQDEWNEQAKASLEINLCKVKEMPYKQGKGHSTLNEIMQFETWNFKKYQNIFFYIVYLQCTCKLVFNKKKWNGKKIDKMTQQEQKGR